MKRTDNGRGCCRNDVKMVECAATALEKMNDMFGVAFRTLKKPPSAPAATVGCVMDPKCQIPACPFRGMPPNVLQKFCAKGTAVGNGRLDRNAMILLPGEVGLRGDRATFHVGQSIGQPIPVADGGRPSGAVYYNVGQKQQPRVVTNGPVKKPIKNLQTPRKHVMQVLPALPASTKPAVGPVTGLPIASDEHVFVMRLGKRHDEPDEKARLQIEVRMPKKKDHVVQESSGTQFLEEELLPAGEMSKSNKKGKKSDKKAEKKSAKKGKK